MRPAGTRQAEEFAFGLVPALRAVGAQSLAQARQILAQGLVDRSRRPQRLVDRHRLLLALDARAVQLGERPVPRTGARGLAADHLHAVFLGQALEARAEV